MDFNASLRRAMKTGTVLLGQNSTQVCMTEGKAQMVVVAENCPPEYKHQITTQENVFVYTFGGTSVALGKACGKPFMVSALAIVDPGESDILSLKRA
jgi:large subunit ribosomal protein L30e